MMRPLFDGETAVGFDKPITSGMFFYGIRYGSMWFHDGCGWLSTIIGGEEVILLKRAE